MHSPEEVGCWHFNSSSATEEESPDVPQYCQMQQLDERAGTRVKATQTVLPCNALVFCISVVITAITLVLEFRSLSEGL